MVWLVLVLMAYAVVKNISQKIFGTDNEQSSIARNEMELQAGAKEISSGSIFDDPSKIINFSAIKNLLTPQKTIALHIKDKAIGSGQPVVCGQQVTVNYRSFAIDEKTMDTGKEIEQKEKMDFKIGENKVMPALERGIVGMQKSGERSIFSPGSLSYGVQNFSRDDTPATTDIRFDVKLLEISPALPDYTAFRVIGDAPKRSVFSCGTKAKLHVSIWSIDGNKLYDTKEKDNDSKPVVFTVGKSEVFFGLEQGVLGMYAGMRRNLIVPPTMQKTLHNNTPIVDFPFPKNQTVIVDIEYVP